MQQMNSLTLGEKLGKCLDVLRLMQVARLASNRPKAHAWHDVNVELVLSVVAGGQMGLEIITTEVNRRTGRVVRDDVVYSAEGVSAEKLMEEALSTLECAIRVYMRESELRRPESVPKPVVEEETGPLRTIVFSDGANQIRVKAPTGCWFSMNLFALGRGAWTHDN